MTQDVGRRVCFMFCLKGLESLKMLLGRRAHTDRHTPSHPYVHFTMLGFSLFMKVKGENYVNFSKAL